MNPTYRRQEKTLQFIVCVINKNADTNDRCYTNKNGHVNGIRDKEIIAKVTLVVQKVTETKPFFTLFQHNLS